MSYFAVIREAGRGWTDGKGAMEQPDAADHAVFMKGLAEEGFVLFAGPLAGTEHGRLRVLLIVDAEAEAEIEHRLGADPWTGTKRLGITSIEPWTIFVGTQRLRAGCLGSGASA
jgi:uncharacterized protein YciI